MPSWRYTLDLTAAWKAADDNGSTFDLVYAVVNRLNALQKHAFKEDEDLTLFIDDFSELLSDAEDQGRDVDKNDFDSIWKHFYDWADTNRVWVKIH
jgi:hypothetical protein